MHGVHYFAFVMTQCAFQIDSLHIVLHLMVRVKLYGLHVLAVFCVCVLEVRARIGNVMASIGLVAQHYWKLPGFENLPSGFSVLGTQEGLLGLFALFLVSGCLENSWREDPNGAKEPGNFGDPFGLQMYTQDMRMKELNNGRMAMISVLGIFAAEMVSGKDAIQQFGLQALGRGQLRSSGSSFTGKTSAQSAQSQFVTRRAFQPSQQISASEPLGFFDPLEFTKVGDEQGFRKLRTSEIKHGRALLAQLDESRIREVSCVCVDINSDECMTNELYNLLFQ